ncbi:O-succinylhomoserine sulfhydrylase [Methylophilaceae bacterium]|jgi:O-succinylhomoserine sulfhydrylase|nr:O-succinylhomoserine sulfhydrylase [Methylophilaceae bacterium]
MKKNKFNTDAIRAGTIRTGEGEHSEALFLTSSFVFKNAKEASDRFSNSKMGNVYSRFTNPSVTMFEERLAALEGAEKCVATSSGMAAILACFMSLCSSGDHVVISKSIFGTSVQLLNNILRRWGLDVTYVNFTDLDEWSEAIKKNTKLFFVETPSNPLTEICDIKSLAELAHGSNIKLVVDNCFCTPALQKPILFGADIIIHSATKYIDGQGRCVGGAVLGNKKDMNEVYSFLRSAGPTMSAFNAWVFLKGLETLSLRMNAHSDNALELALWLEAQKKVLKVYYPGLKSHPQYDLAIKQQSSGGGIVSFEVKGGKPEAWKTIDSTRMLSITANLGDTKSTITHPNSTTHSRLTVLERADVGISDNLIRIAVGLEDIQDIKSDLNYLNK